MSPSFTPPKGGRVADAFVPPPKVYRETTMEFDKIRWDGKVVELDYTEIGAGGSGRVVEEKGAGPSPALKGALKAFASYVVWAVSMPEEWSKRVDVRGVTIKRPDDGPRGIVVTAVLTCPRARNAGIAINTPFLTEPPDGYSGDHKGFLSDEVIDLVDRLEEAASNYHDGEREQIQLIPDENAASPKQNGDGETRKGRAKKDKSHVPGVGTVFNPDATEPLTDELLRQLLLSVERDVPIDAIAAWLSSERQQAQTWATARQKELIDALKPDEKVPSEPPVLLRSATPALIGVPPEKTAPAKKGKGKGNR